MARGQKRKGEVDEDDLLAWFFALLASSFGLALIIISQTQGGKCKLRDVDFSSWMDNDKPGHIPVVGGFEWPT